MKLQEDSADFRMLTLIGQSLQFVRGLRLGDRIPSEMHSGAASWKVSDHHRTCARGRVYMNLVSWVNGEETALFEATNLKALATDPDITAQLTGAYEKLADALNLEQEKRTEVTTMIDDLCEELAFVESLHEDFQTINVVERRLNEMELLYRSDRGVMENLAQAILLCEIPMNEYQIGFDTLYAQTSEIVSVLSTLPAQIEYIRKFRDDIRPRLLAWSSLADKWSDFPVERTMASENMIMETYQFLAQRFLPQKDWELLFMASGNAGKGKTEAVW